jgi:hypothetical protein
MGRFQTASLGSVTTLENPSRMFVMSFNAPPHVNGAFSKPGNCFDPDLP